MTITADDRKRWREARSWYRQVEQRLAAKLHGMSVPAYMILAELRAADGELTQRSLQRRLGFSRATISGIITGLRARGFVAHRAAGHDEDRRNRFIVLTEAGSATVKLVSEAPDE